MECFAGDLDLCFVVILPESGAKTYHSPGRGLRSLCVQNEKYCGLDAVLSREVAAAVIQLILFLVIGIGLFCSLYFLARRRHHSERDTEALLEARTALTTLRVGLLPPEIVRRIRAQEDMDFMVSQAPEQLRGLFFDERKRLALLWVAEVRRQVISLSHFHRHSARLYGELKPGTEIRLAAEFAGLLLACRIVQCVLYVTGPYAVPNVMERTANAADRICALSEKSLGFLRPMYQSSGR